MVGVWHLSSADGYDPPMILWWDTKWRESYFVFLEMWFVSCSTGHRKSGEDAVSPSSSETAVGLNIDAWRLGRLNGYFPCLVCDAFVEIALTILCQLVRKDTRGHYTWTL